MHRRRLNRTYFQEAVKQQRGAEGLPPCLHAYTCRISLPELIDLDCFLIPNPSSNLLTLFVSAFLTQQILVPVRKNFKRKEDLDLNLNFFSFSFMMIMFGIFSVGSTSLRFLQVALDQVYRSKSKFKLFNLRSNYLL